jgi:hypothetical protein
MLSGMPIMVLKRTKVLRIVMCVTLLPLAVLLAFACVSAATAEEPEPVMSLVFGLLAAGLGALFAWLFRRETNREIGIYQDGVAKTVGGVTKELRYADVLQVWFRAVRVQPGGLVGAAIGAAVDAASKAPAKPLSETSDNITVRLVGGESTIKLDSNDRGVVAAFEEVLRRVNPRLIEEGYRLARGGQPVTFGKITLSVQGVQFGRGTPIPFSDIEKLSIAGGRLSVKKRGAWLSKGGTQIKDIPNVFALVEVFNRLSGGSVATSAELGRNLAGRQGF